MASFFLSFDLGETVKRSYSMASAHFTKRFITFTSQWIIFPCGQGPFGDFKDSQPQR